MKALTQRISWLTRCIRRSGVEDCTRGNVSMGSALAMFVAFMFILLKFSQVVSITMGHEGAVSFSLALR